MAPFQHATPHRITLTTHRITQRHTHRHTALRLKTGMANIITALKSHCPALAAAAATSQLSVGSATTILPMRSAEDMEAWQKLDDVIMVTGLLFCCYFAVILLLFC